VNTEVYAGQDHCQEQPNQTNCNHSLSSLEPVRIISCKTAAAFSPQALMLGIVHTPFGRGKADDVQDGSQSEADKDGASKTAEADRVDSHISSSGNSRHDDGSCLGQ